MQCTSIPVCFKQVLLGLHSLFCSKFICLAKAWVEIDDYHDRFGSKANWASDQMSAVKGSMPMFRLEMPSQILLSDASVCTKSVHVTS